MRTSVSNIKKIRKMYSAVSRRKTHDFPNHTGCPQKKLRLLWKAIAPLRIIVGIKVGGVSESAGADLSGKYHNFPVAQKGAEIFEFKVDPVPKLTFLNVMSGV